MKISGSSEAEKNTSSASTSQETIVQRSLTVGAENDPLEEEAETMADKVMRMPEPGFVQRKCAACEEEEKIQTKPLVSFIQRKGEGSGTKASEGVSSAIHQTKGGGNNLAEGTKSFMESRFGSDFSGVKIHTSDYAVQMSKELNAKAFTVGNDIYFNQGQYNPESSEGKHLLAHELTHTIQQKGADKQISKQEADTCTYPDPADKDREIHLNLGLSAVRVYSRTDPSNPLQFDNLVLGAATSTLARQNGWCRMYSVQSRVARTRRKGLLNFVNYCGDFGFHSNFWQRRRRGRITPIPGAQSHGCARLNDASASSTNSGDSQAFFDAVRVGDCVRLYNRDFWRTPTFKQCSSEGADCTTTS